MSDDEDWQSDVEEDSDDDWDEEPKKKTAAKKTTTAAAATKKKTTTAAAKKAKVVELDNSDDDDEPKPKKTTKAPKKPAAAPRKKAAAKKKKAESESELEDDSFVVPDDDDDDDDDESNNNNSRKQPTTNITKNVKSVDETYKRMELLDQILLRPDTYIGSTEKQEEELWIWENERMVRRKISYVPGLYKIFDEILVNAADNIQRPLQEGQKKMKQIKVEIDPEHNRIMVWNDGPGVPVEMHKKEQMYVPEMIFGHLLTSSNYDDSEKRLAGGRNGFGAKLANAFSTEFLVECADSGRRKLFKQTFKANLKNREKPEITTYSKATDYTQITFYPDLSKFGMLSMLDDDNVALLTKRVYDIAGCNPSLKVTLNGEDLNIKSFQSYIQLYFKSLEKAPEIYYERVSERWEIAIALSHEGQFNQVSFVNSICTPKGGTHVTHALNDVLAEIGKAVQKKHKSKAEIKPAFIKNHLFVFVNSLIENPAFDSQTKENLSTKITSFGSQCHPSEKFLKKIVESKSGIVDQIISYAKHKEEMAMLRNTTATTKKGSRLNIPKLDDANLAGTSHSEDCTLILTEGDSAKTLAVSGISVVGWDHYGCFPLRGKLLNVRESDARTMMTNEEIVNIINIMGLQHGKQYEDVKSLRYGHLMIMTDQDHDGSHIKGLLLNFIHHFWPSLLRIEGFLVEFVTPIIKATKGNKTIAFYTIPEYLAWREANNNGKGYEIKYYKGLGTSTEEEAKEYFSQLVNHKIDFEYDNGADDAIDKAFNKKRANDRKTWMDQYTPGAYLDQYGIKKVKITDFIDKELILFSIADCERSIPSIVDGFKTSQRKILFSCFKRNLKKEIKVAQLIGYVSEQSAYHHGDQSLASAIIGLAQTYVGANNINVLYPGGGFGSRLAGGKDSSAPRYINTRLEEIARTLFPEEDHALLSHLTDDGKRVQPKWYIPVIPMILVNGSKGIGTGWSSTIPNYNPRDLIENMKLLIEGKELKPIVPWYRGFKGTIELQTGKTSNFVAKGVWRKLDEYRLEITELPIESWTNDFKDLVQNLIDPQGKQKRKEAKEKIKQVKKGKATSTKVVKRKKKDEDDDEVVIADPIVKSMSNQGTVGSIHFIIETLKPVDEIDVNKTFKLEKKLAETNMTVFDEEGRIKQFETTTDIIKYFFKIRLEYYQKRKDYLCDKLEEEHRRLSNKARFILAVVNKELVIANVKRLDLVKKLKEMKFDQFSKKVGKKAEEQVKKSKVDKVEEELAVNSDQEEEGSDDEMEMDDDCRGYDYLLSLPLWSLTLERVKKIQEEREKKKVELDKLRGTAITTMYLLDLDKFSESLDKQDAEDQRLKDKGDKYKKSVKGKTALPRTRKAKAAPKKKTLDSDDDDDYEPAMPKKATTKKAAAAVEPKPIAPKPAAKRKKDEASPSLGCLCHQNDDSMDVDQDSFIVDDDDDDFVPPTKKVKETSKPAPPKPAPAKKKAAAKKKKVESESESDFISDQESEASDAETPPPKPRPTRTRNTLPKLNFFTSDDSDDAIGDDSDD
ncbi:DNA topoisomerase II [Heterostelium album PN500]|uniref:DNA topoisomerase 2 n=1 Tax=Heterostelium pallidum (strain ATCC 26659 / Pp 5 / PN500) TaxID=670386 RepID=D3B7U7_HETP5|nr:DNA topoisomerase II [Heterostelium album PN500]EFA82840.1 DNA topoisomerase II [Heterostelium album PN500]|eukprot:XP_020434957.1 DNA topoisomerase II [Heterostelium album PN500]